MIYCELHIMRSHWEGQGQLTKEGFFFSTLENLMINTGMTRHSVRQSIKKLEDLGLIETFLSAQPGKTAVRYFGITTNGNLEKIIREEGKRSEEEIRLWQDKINLFTLSGALEEFPEQKKLLNWFKECYDLAKDHGENVGVNFYNKATWRELLREVEYEIGHLEYQDVRQLIEFYFLTKYREPFSFAHFASPKILKILHKEVTGEYSYEKI